mmetsp:Transcript_6150/g.9470  ORF Transcript_6150/g.9470 Transcript_6150/m.9470 type:complete len:362 (+) Transcript_6150:213-1298(+)|eukprot:CAMPEP_0184344906 /NCGR_PEP_ID=MMETSP1089-20130417/13368_1 /TAXON_ID=38269 ORGANISM="Gloeochaete wittrockiana, Strain SAG46.84" /NCGR_SAMPLE_ID=MMETSP1089 /ASSEMBLY_ACC=CAM_ASM_000445 /LENGTH=361 /DNA_ID=CAMNT_0026674979 /DNA_START=209 /DNA_END=1294 /DNA_ORIENTATION=-
MIGISRWTSLFRSWKCPCEAQAEESLERKLGRSQPREGFWCTVIALCNGTSFAPKVGTRRHLFDDNELSYSQARPLRVLVIPQIPPSSPVVQPLSSLTSDSAGAASLEPATPRLRTSRNNGRFSTQRIAFIDRNTHGDSTISPRENRRSSSAPGAFSQQSPSSATTPRNSTVEWKAPETVVKYQAKRDGHVLSSGDDSVANIRCLSSPRPESTLAQPAAFVPITSRAWRDSDDCEDDGFRRADSTTPSSFTSSAVPSPTSEPDVSTETSQPFRYNGDSLATCRKDDSAEKFDVTQGEDMQQQRAAWAKYRQRKSLTPPSRLTTHRIDFVVADELPLVTPRRTSSADASPRTGAQTARQLHY